MMCDCRRHHDMTSRCTCTCPSHEEIRAEQERARREWSRGDVVALGDTDLRGFVTERRGQALRIVWPDGSDNEAEIVSARPLVVIDPEDREQVARLGYLYYAGINGPRVEGSLLDEFQRALREFANPTPPKPEEPTGLGAVVESASGRRYIRQHDGWWRGDEPCTLNWAAVNAVRVLSEGVQA